MSSIFDLNNRFYQGIGFVFQLAFLSLLWIICCLPLITAGAATSAAYYTAVKVLRKHEGYTHVVFFHSFKENFKQSTLIWIFYLLLINVARYELQIISVTEKPWLKRLLLPLIILLVVFTVIVLYYLTLLTRFENTALSLLKSSVIISILNLPRTLLLLCAVTVLGILTWLIPIMLLIGPGLTFYSSAAILEKVYVKYIDHS